MRAWSAGSFVRVVPGSRAAGPARTASCGAADNLAAHRALERIEPGDVLVLAVADQRPVANLVPRLEEGELTLDLLGLRDD